MATVLGLEMACKLMQGVVVVLFMPGRAVAVGERPKDAAGLTWLLSGTLLASRDFISEEDGGPAEDPPVVVCPDVSDGDEAV